MRSLFILALALLLGLSSCTASPVPATSPPTQMLQGGTPSVPTPIPPPTDTPAPAHTPTPSPTATLTPRPTAKGEQDAFALTYFPWADSPVALPIYTGEGKVRVVNSAFFEEPPFFGFDIHPPEQWYHVIGVDHWAGIDSELISPTVNRNRPLRDGDRVLIHGHIDGLFLIASYVGFNDGTPYYYRSLLRADELRPGVLPGAYDGLEVWVRGVLDVNAGRGQFYHLPEGSSFDPVYIGQEALVAGRLVINQTIDIEVSRGIYVRNGDRYVKILEGRPATAARNVYEQGVIRVRDASARWVLIESTDGRSVEASLDDGTRIEFAEGSVADPGELLVGRQIEVIGRPTAKDKLSAANIRIVSCMASGPMYAAYIAADSGELWSISLDGAQRRQITRLAQASAPAQLGNAEFSPDGLRFVFAQTRGDQSILVLGDLQSGEVRQLLTDDEWQETDPTWSAEGSRIAFCRHRLEGERRIDGGLWLLNWKYDSVRRLSIPAEEGWWTVSPRWSPNGQHIAFGHSSRADQQFSRLYVLSPPSDSRLVLEHVSEWRWSADSTQLLCTRQAPDEERARLWVVQQDGTAATWLSPTGVHDHHGRWSPDGTAIVFLSRPAGSSAGDNLWVMRHDGLRRAQVIPFDRVSGQPCWSANSQVIVFMRVASGGENGGLWIVGRDGAGLRRLAADAVALVGTYREP